MRHEVTASELRDKTRQLMEGPLKHIKAAALAAALLPLASLAATPASAQSGCPSGGVCGTVFNDVNNDGVRDATETGVEFVKVSVCQLCDGTDTIEGETNQAGFYSIFVPDGVPTTVAILIPPGTQASPSNVGDEATDSDGVPDGSPFSVATGVDRHDFVSDFGLHTSEVSWPGTGTPGYWKNHPEAWPVGSITVGGYTYTKAQAIAWLGKVGKDKTTTMFSSLVSAKLNLIAGNPGSCVSAAITAADKWMASNPVGSNVAGSSAAWAYGEQFHITLDNYNNGRLCAPHRN
jgi:SdrD B-like domain